MNKMQRAIIGILMGCILLALSACDSDLLGVNTTQTQEATEETSAPAVEYGYEDLDYLTFYGAYESLTMSEALYDVLSYAQAYDVGVSFMAESQNGAFEPASYDWSRQEATAEGAVNLQSEPMYLVVTNNLSNSRNFVFLMLADGIPQKFHCGEDSGEDDYSVCIQVPAEGCYITPVYVEIGMLLDREDHDFCVLLIEDGGDLTVEADHIFPFERQALTVSDAVAYADMTDAGTASTQVSGVISNRLYYDADLTHRILVNEDAVITLPDAEAVFYYYMKLSDPSVSCVSFLLVDDLLYQGEDTETVFYWESEDNCIFLPIHIPLPDQEAHTVTVVTIPVAQSGSVEAVQDWFILSSPRIVFSGGAS